MARAHSSPSVPSSSCSARRTPSSSSALRSEWYGWHTITLSTSSTLTIAATTSLSQLVITLASVLLAAATANGCALLGPRSALSAACRDAAEQSYLTSFFNLAAGLSVGMNFYSASASQVVKFKFEVSCKLFSRRVSL
jgi:hypothetical protein